MIITSVLLIALILFYVGAILVDIPYKKYFVLGVLLVPFVFGAILYDHIDCYVVFAVMYLITSYVLNKNNDVIFYITNIKNNLPIALGVSIIISGAVYYIVSNNASITSSNTINYKDIIANDAIIDIVYLIFMIIFIYIIGSWGISRRRPKYLNLLSRSTNYDGQDKEND